MSSCSTGCVTGTCGGFSTVAHVFLRRSSGGSRRAVTRQLRLLRAHGLIRKVPKTHRYVVSEAGRRTITALLAARNASVDQLTRSVG